jgi:hypothetical protein
MTPQGATAGGGAFREVAAPETMAAADLYIRALAVSLACYALMGKGFAYLGVPPLFVGEMLYVVGLLLLFRSGCTVALFVAVPNVILAVLACWTLLRTIPFVPVYGFDALRDSVVVLYGGFALIVCALLLDRPERLRTGVMLFGRFAAIYGALATVVYGMQVVLGHAGLSLTVPGSDIPLLYIKPSDMAVHLAGSAVFAILFFPRVNWIWVGLLVAGMAISGAYNRGGLLAMAAAVSVALAYSGRIRQLSGVMLAGLVAMAVAALLDLNLAMWNRDRELSVQQLVLNIVSVFGQSSSAELDITKAWRLQWWQAILDYTLHGDYFWSGKGFGVSLAASDGFDNTTPPGAPVLRSPHNVSMTILARAGVPGLVLWLALLLSWFFCIGRSALTARLRGDEAWFRLFLFLGCYLAASLINASFEVALEGPAFGIWFWVLFGFGIGAARIYRTHRHVAARREAAVPAGRQDAQGHARPGAARRSA